MSILLYFVSWLIAERFWGLSPDEFSGAIQSPGWAKMNDVDRSGVFRRFEAIWRAFA
jgi:hypothetical protein